MSIILSNCPQLCITVYKVLCNSEEEIFDKLSTKFIKFAKNFPVKLLCCAISRHKLFIILFKIETQQSTHANANISYCVAVYSCNHHEHHCQNAQYLLKSFHFIL